jgi:site-specific recombinase XerD
MQNPSNTSGGSFGPLFPYINPYCTKLKEERYVVTSAWRHLRVFERLSRWLGRTNRRLRDMNEAVATNFLRTVRGRSQNTTARAMVRRLLPMLRHMGAIPPPKVQLTPAERLRQEYRRFLSAERGLVPGSIAQLDSVAGKFLSAKFGAGSLSLSKLTASDVIQFVKLHAKQSSPSTARDLLKGMRSFLRYLYYKRLIHTDLSHTVPKVACWSFSTMPKYLTSEQVRQVLRHCDRTTPLGRRDYAILLLLARLGLRAGEVAQLNLEDIDWENARIRIVGKGNKPTQMPLPADAGKAIASYLRHDRPRCDCRRLFVSTRAPVRGFGRSCVISCIVKWALVRAGVVAPGKSGAHLLRHGLATDMLRKGASLDEIGEVLRHKSRETTAIYAKVDLASLRALALPWPGGAQ